MLVARGRAQGTLVPKITLPMASIRPAQAIAMGSPSIWSSKVSLWASFLRIRQPLHPFVVAEYRRVDDSRLQISAFKSTGSARFMANLYCEECV